jgi:hypothetical protein
VNNAGILPSLPAAAFDHCAQTNSGVTSWAALLVAVVLDVN